jgi:methylated-DNA-[protein]-cysteine S-methyltransferase
MMLFYKHMASPAGDLKLVACNNALVAVLWARERNERIRLGPMVGDAGHAVLLAAECQLEDYFAGRRTEFELAMELRGTEFQKRVWHALRRIPFGATRSYSQLAAELGIPGSVRAVGAANGKNPLAIVVPCHRVIGADGSLTGFAGGLDVKAMLLEFEARRSSSTAIQGRLF